MKVLESKVLVQVEKNENAATRKLGALEIPVNNEYETAKVVSIGDKIDPNVLKPNDVCYIYSNSGKRIFHEGIEYRVITINEIIAVL